VDCREVQNLLHPYSDGELDLVRHLQVEHHLADCAECAERERGLWLLRVAVASGAPYHRAPDSLQTRLQAAPPPTPTAPVRRGGWQPSASFAATAAGVALLAAASLTAGLLLSRSGAAEDRLAEQVVAGHVRSRQVAHLTDVASSDRHAVKPWFRGKVDFSPQVPDLSAEGYPLSGGRLDYLAGRPVAALVYHRRDHDINLFTWPAAGDEERPVRAIARQGFHMRRWQQSGMTYWAISDLNASELDEFVRRFREHAAANPP
jgi:anti-sigma factor RsiW